MAYRLEIRTDDGAIHTLTSEEEIKCGYKQDPMDYSVIAYEGAAKEGNIVIPFSRIVAIAYDKDFEL